MGISKSIKVNDWVAEALVFSGRPNPMWKVNEKTVEKLEKIWCSLESPLKEKVLFPPSLGYRGCFLRGNTIVEWYVHNEIVTLKISASSESRLDKNRLFEKLLLKSAPQGLLPPYCIE